MTFTGSKLKVLILGELYTNTPEYKSFSEKFELISYKLTTKEQFIQDITTKYTDISAIYCKYLGFSPIGGLRGELVDHLPVTLRIIVSTPVGFDHFDIKALGQRGITVCNSPGHAAVSVADHALYLTLNLFRYYNVFERSIQGTANSNRARSIYKTELPWNQETGRPVTFLGMDGTDKAPSDVVEPVHSFGEKIGDRFISGPRGHSVGIAGLGDIGKEIGKRLNAIGMTVHYTKRVPLTKAEQAELGFKATYHESFESMLPHSELLVLSLPLSAHTHHIVNEKTIAQLPDGARIVNIGRGGLIDTQALIASLKSGKISGVGLDVFEKEPSIEPELLGRWDVILTPHLGSSTYDVAVAAENTCMTNITEYYFGDMTNVTSVNNDLLKN